MKNEYFETVQDFSVSECVRCKRCKVLLVEKNLYNVIHEEMYSEGMRSECEVILRSEGEK